MHARLLLVLVAASLLLLAACAEDDDSGDDITQDQGEQQVEDDLEESTLEGPGQAPEPVDLPQGLAATVDDDEISVEDVEGRFDAVLAVPEVADQLEEADEDTFSDQIRAQILGQMILGRIVELGAADLGVDVDSDALDERELAEAEAAGGEEAFTAELEAQGITPDQVREQLRIELLFQEIEQELTADLDDEAREADETGMSEADLVVQEWLFGQLAQRDVAVDAQYGVWIPESGQVIPADALG
jgi:hypothetical protein